MEVGISPTRGQVVARFIICSSGSDQKVCLVPKKFVVYRSALFVCMNLPQRRPWMCTVDDRLEPPGAEIVYTA